MQNYKTDFWIAKIGEKNARQKDKIDKKCRQQMDAQNKNRALPLEAAQAACICGLVNPQHGPFSRVQTMDRAADSPQHGPFSRVNPLLSDFRSPFRHEQRLKLERLRWSAFPKASTEATTVT